MDSTDYAFEYVKKRQYPFWKIYKGANRVAICDTAENPNEDPETAFKLFQEEVNGLTAGKYQVNVYRNSKGEKGGLKIDFEKKFNTPTPSNSGMNETFLFQQAQLMVQTNMMLERIEKKQDAILEVLQTLADGDNSNDGKIFDLLKMAVSQSRKNSGAEALSSATTRTVEAASTNRGLWG